MLSLFVNLTEVDSNRELLRRARYGVIHFQAGVLRRIQLRAWPKFASLLESWWSDRLGVHQRGRRGACRLYYNEPRSCPGFLALPYLASDRNATVDTIFGALHVLDEIATIKQSRAIVCEVANPRISDRLMRRQGWERHLPNARRRHYIKRFHEHATGNRSSRQAISHFEANAFE